MSLHCTKNRVIAGGSSFRAMTLRFSKISPAKSASGSFLAIGRWWRRRRSRTRAKAQRLAGFEDRPILDLTIQHQEICHGLNLFFRVADESVLIFPGRGLEVDRHDRFIVQEALRVGNPTLRPVGPAPVEEAVESRALVFLRLDAADLVTG